MSVGNSELGLGLGQKLGLGLKLGLELAVAHARRLGPVLTLSSSPSQPCAWSTDHCTGLQFPR